VGVKGHLIPVKAVLKGKWRARLIRWAAEIYRCEGNIKKDLNSIDSAAVGSRLGDATASPRNQSFQDHLNSRDMAGP